MLMTPPPKRTIRIQVIGLKIKSGIRYWRHGASVMASDGTALHIRSARQQDTREGADRKDARRPDSIAAGMLALLPAASCTANIRLLW
jgi:hypothetical protein